jgi:hypothetical protein
MATTPTTLDGIRTLALTRLQDIRREIQVILDADEMTELTAEIALGDALTAFDRAQEASRSDREKAEKLLARMGMGRSTPAPIAPAPVVPAPRPAPVPPAPVKVAPEKRLLDAVENALAQAVQSGADGTSVTALGDAVDAVEAAGFTLTPAVRDAYDVFVAPPMNGIWPFQSVNESALKSAARKLMAGLENLRK